MLGLDVVGTDVVAGVEATGATTENVRGVALRRC
jgi:hypothetical protein